MSKTAHEIPEEYRVYTTRSRTKKSKIVYHDTADCYALDRVPPEKIVAKDKRELSDRWTHCRKVDCGDNRDKTDEGTVTCPKCGNSVKRLRPHLPCGGQDDG